MSSDDSRSPEPGATDRFPGFSRPHYTQVPNELLDHLMVDLSHTELRCLLYIIRRTFGFQRDADAISLSQFVNGITKADGTVLDRGCGVSKSGAAAALRSLEKRGYIVARRASDEKRGDLPTTYALRMQGDPVSNEETPPVQREDTPCPTNSPAPVQRSDTQKKVQNKASKERPISHREKEPRPISGGSSIPDRRPPLTPRQMWALDPVADRDLILRSRIEPTAPAGSSPDEYMVWDDLGKEWRKRNGK